MRNRAIVLTLCFSCLPHVAAAQDPLSAIDWLRDATPVIQPRPQPQRRIDEPPVSQGASTPSVSVTPLDQAQADSVGLLPSATTGLPANLWKGSSNSTLARLLRAQDVQNLPAMQSLLYTLLLAEAEAPSDTGKGNAFLLARIDTLIALGAVEHAQALLDRAGPTTPELFARWFDTTLLTGNEHLACQSLLKSPHLAPDYATQVFCTAREGSWQTAVITLETARALGHVNDLEDRLLARFLDPDLFEGDPLPRPPVRPAPLIFRLFAAIGEPLPTAPLPRAFSVADLSDTVGWKPRIEAAERLARTGALSENMLLGIWTERHPAASGGVWDRVESIQRFDIAIETGNAQAIGRTLAPAWSQIATARLEDPFAKLYAARLMQIPLQRRTAELAYRIALLGPDYETAANAKGATLPAMKFLTGLAQGAPDASLAKTPEERAIATAFADTSIPTDLQNAMKNNRLGESILDAMRLYQRAANGETKWLAQSLIAFRAMGLEDTARRAALHLLLLKRGV